MGAQVETSSCTKPRQCDEPAKCVKVDPCHWTTHVIDISSIEELFQRDGPLLAEDCERYHFENDAAIPEPEPVVLPQPQVQAADPALQEKKVEQHLKNVMERIKARKQDEVRQRFDSAIQNAAHRVDLIQDSVDTYEAYNTYDSSADQIVKDVQASLQAAQERMELRTRATAALQAAAERAAKTREGRGSENSLDEVARPPSTKKAPVKATKVASRTNNENDVLKARIQKALAAAQQRHASEAA